MTQRLVWVGLLCLIATAQDSGEYQVYTEHPRLLLNARRVRLLKRERERQSMRWVQFDALMAGKARMAEPGFAGALYALVTDTPAPCKAAADWAATGAKAGDPADIRQIALVFDWCQGKLSEAQSAGLVKRLAAAARLPGDELQLVRSRLMAALAIADEEPKLAETVARNTVETWWKKSFAPRLKKEMQPFETRSQLYALIEILHMVRDNFKSDLREDGLLFFEELPPYLLLTYYPQSWPAAENEYRIPVFYHNGDPDLEQAALSRAAELALVAFDGNPQPVQFLQGWLTQDRFQLKGTFGVVYEFFWANPYLPGLSFTYMPDILHARGNLLVRGSWDEDSPWFGALDGKIQYFQQGRRMGVTPKANTAPLQVGEVWIHFWRDGLKFTAGTLPYRERDTEDEKRAVEETAFVVGAKPNGRYDIEPDDEEMYEARADVGGIVALKFSRGRKINVRMREVTISSR